MLEKQPDWGHWGRTKQGHALYMGGDGGDIGKTRGRKTGTVE